MPQFATYCVDSGTVVEKEADNKWQILALRRSDGLVQLKRLGLLYNRISGLGCTAGHRRV